MAETPGADIDRTFLINRRHRATSVVNKDTTAFKKVFEEGHIDDALKRLLSNSNQDEQIEMVKIAVHSRKNDAIVSLLQKAFPLYSSGDTTDGKNYSIFYEKAIKTATLNDDPDTLEAILSLTKDWTRSWSAGSQVLEDNPLLLASLDGYTECMKLLHHAGYRIRLAASDWELVTASLSLAHTSLANTSLGYRPTSGVVRRRTGKREGWSTNDPVERYLCFKAYANPDYLSIGLLDSGNSGWASSKDALRRAFTLAAHAKLLSDYFPEHVEEYRRIGESLQGYASSILGYCNNNQDVETLLSYTREEEDEEVSNWHIALWDQHKSFVAHPYYQHYTWTQIKGTNFDPYQYSLLPRLLTFPTAVLLFLFYPPIILADSIFREGNILFESPSQFDKCQSEGVSAEDQESRSPKEHKVWAFFRERIHRPLYRMCVCAFWEAVFLLIFYLALTKTNDGEANFDTFDILTWTFIVHHLIEDLVALWSRTRTFMSSFWSKYTLASNLILVAGAIVSYIGLKQAGHDNRAQVSGNHAMNIGLTFVAYGATMYFLRTVRWFLLHRSIGPNVITMIRIIKDVVYVFFVFLVIYLSFSVGIWFMYKPFTERGGVGAGEGCNSTYCFSDQTIKDNPGMRGVLGQMFWRVFDGEASQARIQTQGHFNKTEVFSLEFSHMMGLSLWAMYQGITVILLINILIAQMNNTYLKIWENVDAEWKYSKSYFQVQYLAPCAVLPPPFRWFYYFAKLRRYIRDRNKEVQQNNSIKMSSKPLKRNTSSREMNEMESTYFKLLQKLVETKMQAEAEATAAENFKDLRVDFRNIIENELKKPSEDVKKLRKIIADCSVCKGKM